MIVDDALAALVHPAEVVPAVAGLYAFHGDAAVWRTLGLGDPPDARPLYVGKSERSLHGRDVGTHFETGRTGSSTVRRALAALLRDELALRGVPRNLTTPDGSANYALEAAGDARLTEWMHEHLRLAVWPSPPCDLGDVETQVLLRLQPPLNLSKVATPWSKQVRAARAAMAAESREPQ